MVGVDYKPPANTIGQDGIRRGPRRARTTKASEPVDLAVWWRSFKDPELNSLITRAIRGQQHVSRPPRPGSARPGRSWGVEWGNEFPTLFLDGSYTRTQTARNSGVHHHRYLGQQRHGRVGHDWDRVHRWDRFDKHRRGRPGTTGSTGTGSGTTGGTAGGEQHDHHQRGLNSKRQVDLYQAGFDAGWEIDVFGGLRREIEAAEDDLEMQVKRPPQRPGDADGRGSPATTSCSAGTSSSCSSPTAT